MIRFWICSCFDFGSVILKLFFDNGFALCARSGSLAKI